MSRKTRDWNAEFECLKEMQQDRMALTAAMVCHERCIGTYWTNMHLWFEKNCVEKCLSKYMQAGLITNFNCSQFAELEQQQARQKLKRKA